MERVKHNPLVGGGFVGQPRPAPQKNYNFGEVIGAAMEQENDIVNAIKWAVKPAYEIDPGFDILSALEADPLADQYAWQLSRAQSAAEFASIKADILREQRNQQIFAAHPVGGFFAAAASGVISPVSLIPFVGPARGLKGVAQSFALAAAAVSAQEAVLYGLQETRTVEESLFGIAAGTVLGGLLGSASRYGTPAELARIERGMVDTPGEMTISRSLDGGEIEEIVISPRTDVTTEADELVAPSPAQKEASEDEAPAASVQVGPPEFQRNLTRKRSSPEEALDWGGSYLRAELPNGMEVRFTKMPAGSGGAYFVGGEYAMVILRKDGTQVDPPQTRPNQPDIGLAGNTLIERVKDLQAAFAQGKLDKQLDRMLVAAGDEPVFAKGSPASPPASLSAAANPERKIGIARSETWVGRQVDRGADWLETRGVPVAPRVIRAVNDPIGALAKLNPMTRQLDNKLFPAARAWAAKLQIPGIRINDGSASDGTIFARSKVHHAEVAKFLDAFDKTWADYVTDGKGKDVVRAAVGARYKTLGTAPAGKMNFNEFQEAVFVYGQTGQKHPSPEVMRAVEAQRQYFEYVNLKAKQYHKELLEREGMDDEGRMADDLDPNDPDYEEQLGELRGPRALYREQEFGEDNPIQHYVAHMFDNVAVDRLMPEFLRDFTEHGEKLMRQGFEADYARFTKRKENLELQERVLAANETQLTTFFESTVKELEEIDINYGAPLKQVKDLRKAMRDAGASRGEIEEATKQLEDTFPPEYAVAMKSKRQLEKLRTLLSRAGAGLTEKQNRLLDQIEELEDLQLDELDTFARAAVKLEDRLRRIDAKDAKNDEIIKKQYARLVKAAAAYSKANTRTEKLRSRDRLTESAVTKENKAILRLNRDLDRLGTSELKGFDLDELRRVQDSIRQGKLARTQQLNAGRAVRAERIRERAKEMDPKARETFRVSELAVIRRQKQALADTFDKKWADLGAVGRASANDVDFLDQARADAEELHKRILGQPLRVIGIDVLGAERGPQLQRTLNLPLEVKMKYLLRKPENIIRAHAHTMFPDLEMYRATGSVNGARIFEELAQDYKVEQAKLDLLPAGPERERASEKLNAQYEAAVEDWNVLVSRLRHQRGLPSNPDGIAYRMGVFAMNLNVTRFMGMVAISSLPDAARVVFRYGFSTAFKDAWSPLVRDLPRVKAVRQEARRFGIALDPLLHNRAQMMHDTFDHNISRQTLVERGMEFLANKTGFVALFDRWTAEMKYIATNAVFGEFSHALRVVNDPAFSGNAKELTKARKLFDLVGLGPDMQKRIWEQYGKTGGSTEFKDGFRLPNTEAWDDYQAVMALKSGVGQIVDDLIVTPGLDRPSWMDENLAFRMVAQFRSFTFSATNRILMSGLQERDMAFLQGTVFSIALGAISYYTWAMTAGDRAWKEASEADMDKILYEAVSRSGVLGVLSEGQRIGEQIPGLNDWAIFGADESQSRRADSFLGSVLGPTYDLAKKLASVAQGIGRAAGDDPISASTINQARTAMVPYQNVFYLRGLLTAMEESLGSALGATPRSN